MVITFYFGELVDFSVPKNCWVGGVGIQLAFLRFPYGDLGPGLYTQPVPTEKIPGYWVFFGYWVYLFRTYLVNFCMGKYLIPKYLVIPTFWVLCRIEILRDFETYGDSFGLL